MIRSGKFRSLRLERLPAGLGRSEGVVPVPDSIEKRRLAHLGKTRCGLCLIACDRRVQCFCRRARNQAAFDVSAALHEFKAIQQREFFAAFFQSVQHCTLCVVHQEHDVARLYRRAAADANTGRNTLDHGLLGGAHR